MGRNFSGMLWVDDLILAAKDCRNLNEFLQEVQKILQKFGMSINCTKSNTMSLKEKIDKEGIELRGINEELLGVISQTERYKYLGINLGIGKTCQIYDFSRKNIVSKLKSYAGSILRMSKESYAPVLVGVTLWKSYALPSILYGIETASLTKKVIEELESIQGRFATSLIGVRHTASHEAALRELDLTKLEQTIYTRKLQYHLRVSKLPKENLARSSLEECNLKGFGKNKSDEILPEVKLKGEWTSTYRTEIERITLLLDVDMERTARWFSLKKGKGKIKSSIKSYFATQAHETIQRQREHSLRCFPAYQNGLGVQEYLSLPSAETLAQFRLGDAGLGNRCSPAREVCPLCNNGINRESHLVFECRATEHLRRQSKAMVVFLSSKSSIQDPDGKLKLFVGGDLSSNATLQEKAVFLKLLQDKHRSAQEEH